MTKDERYDFLINNEIYTEDFLSGAIAIGSYNTDTLNSVLYYSTGYRDFDQYIECELTEENA